MGRLKYGFKVMFCVFVFSLFWIGLSSFSSFFFFFFLLFCRDGNGSGKFIFFLVGLMVFFIYIMWY